MWSWYRCLETLRAMKDYRAGSPALRSSGELVEGASFETSVVAILRKLSLEELL